MRLSAFKTDSAKETAGVWFPVGAGLEVLVARMRNAKHRERLRELMRPHLQRVRRGQMDLALVEKLNTQAMGETVLLDWKNLQDDDDKPIPYSKEKAVEILGKVLEFADMVSEFASDIENYREEVRADAEGNS